MDYALALTPSIGLTSQDFVKAWNDIPECRAAAEARLEKTSRPAFGLDPVLAGSIAVLGTVALNVASNALYDLIKQALARRGIRREITITELSRPDGTRLLAITIVQD